MDNVIYCKILSIKDRDQFVKEMNYNKGVSLRIINQEFPYYLFYSDRDVNRDNNEYLGVNDNISFLNDVPFLKWDYIEYKLNRNYKLYKRILN